MRFRIAVVDPLRMFTHGVAETIRDAGFDAVTPEDPVAWARDGEPPIVLLTLLRPPDWALLAELRQIRADSTVIAVLEGGDLNESVRALSSGAFGIVRREAGPDIFLAALAAVMSGNSLVPIEVIQAMATPNRSATHPSQVPTVNEIEWLRLLARGVTVANVARQVGYSERMMFRLLRALYGKLSANNRTEAIIVARDRGWL